MGFGCGRGGRLPSGWNALELVVALCCGREMGPSAQGALRNTSVSGVWVNVVANVARTNRWVGQTSGRCPVILQMEQNCLVGW